MAKSYDFLFKVLLIGDSGVGKTCILCRFANDEFRKTHISTIGIDFKMKTIIVDGKRVRIQMWDTAGQERYETITTQYYRRAQGILLVYDITRLESFQNIRKWLKYVDENASPNVQKVILGNKCDVPEEKRKVPTELGQRLADEYNLTFYETSAYADVNVDEAFSVVSQRIMNSMNGNKNCVQTSSAVILDTEKEVHRSSTCCGS